MAILIHGDCAMKTSTSEIHQAMYHKDCNLISVDVITGGSCWYWTVPVYDPGVGRGIDSLRRLVRESSMPFESRLQVARLLEQVEADIESHLNRTNEPLIQIENNGPEVIAWTFISIAFASVCLAGWWLIGQWWN